jgi:NAD-dependent DNA ligase
VIFLAIFYAWRNLSDQKNFDKINKLREEEGLDPFMNPRNTASGSLKCRIAAR